MERKLLFLPTLRVIKELWQPVFLLHQCMAVQFRGHRWFNSPQQTWSESIFHWKNENMQIFVLLNTSWSAVVLKAALIMLGFGTSLPRRLPTPHQRFLEIYFWKLLYLCLNSYKCSTYLRLFTPIPLISYLLLLQQRFSPLISQVGYA